MPAAWGGLVIALLRSLWKSRFRSTVAVGAVVLGTGVLGGSILLAWSGTRMSTARFALQAELDALASDSRFAEDLEQLQAELPQRMAASLELKAHGFLQHVDRVAWAEAVAGAALARRPIAYSATIGSAQWLPLPDELTTWYGNQGLTAAAIHSTDLVLQVQGLHEDELRHVLDTAVAAGGGVTRIERCQLARRTDGIGIDADCTLRRFGLGTPDAGDADGREESP